MQNAILSGAGQGSAGSVPDDVAARIAARSAAARGLDYVGEVRRVLDAALGVMRASGTTAKPRVADIVAAAGVSNDAFYRHFTSKDALVAALLEDGTTRLVGYLSHQMAKEPTAERRLRRWVTGILSQADGGEVAATTLAVLWNAGVVGDDLESGRPSSTGPLASLVQPALVELGSARPELDANLCAHAVVGRLSDHLWGRTRPGRTEVDHLVAFCRRAVSPT